MFDRFRALSAMRQILLIVVGVCTISLVLGIVWFFFLRTTYRPLFTGLRTTDAATIVADLERRKIPFLLAEGGKTILVADDRVDATRLNVMTQDLPLKGTVGFELFNKSDMGLTDFAQKINYQRALQGELERTIMTLDGVDAARVHLSLGEDRIFRDDRVPPKASITVRMRGGARLQDNAAQGIQRLVAAAVPNLETSNVVILDEEGRVIGNSVLPHVAAEWIAPSLEETRAIEQYYEAHIRQALEATEFGQHIIVSVVAGTNQSGGEGTDAHNWSPADRKFPLHINFSSPVSLEPAAEEKIRSLVGEAIGSSATNVDTTVFTILKGAQVTTTIDTRPIERSREHLPAMDQSPAGESSGWFSDAGFLLLPIVLLLGVFLIVRQARGSRRLTQQQRTDFTARLRTALARREDHVTSQP